MSDTIYACLLYTSKELIDLPRMADMAAGMVKNAIRAFLDRDLKLARKVWKADEEVDEPVSYTHL